jgi:hypothetical protein
MHNSDTMYINTAVPFNKATPKNQRQPSYQDRLQMHWESKILFNCPPQDKSSFLKGHFYIAEGVAL